MSILTVDEARAIAAQMHERRVLFGAGEDEVMSYMVVLLNAGWERHEVTCVGGEWSGTKGDVYSDGEIPRCPNSHVLMESPRYVRLGFVETGAPQ
jgi:hypothetical protein